MGFTQWHYDSHSHNRAKTLTNKTQTWTNYPQKHYGCTALCWLSSSISIFHFLENRTIGRGLNTNSKGIKQLKWMHPNVEIPVFYLLSLQYD